MTTNPNITDAQRVEFLKKLDRCELVVSDWEARFIASFLDSNRPATWFTPGRRESCDKMWMKYGHEREIGQPYVYADHAKPVKAVIPPADPTGCEYLVKLDGVQQRCNLPAEWQSPGGFRYCQGCAEIAKELCERMKKNFRLVKFP